MNYETPDAPHPNCLCGDGWDVSAMFAWMIERQWERGHYTLYWPDRADFHGFGKGRLLAGQNN